MTATVVAPFPNQAVNIEFDLLRLGVIGCDTCSTTLTQIHVKEGEDLLCFFDGCVVHLSSLLE